MPYPGQFAWSPLDEYQEPVAPKYKPFVRKYSLLPGQVDVAGITGIAANPLTNTVSADGGNPVSQGSNMVRDAVVRADGGNNMAATAGTMSGAPVVPLAATPEADNAVRTGMVDSAPIDYPQEYASPGSRLRVQAGSAPGSRAGLGTNYGQSTNAGYAGRGTPRIFQDSNDVMGPVPQDERTYGGSNWSNYAATSGRQRGIDQGLRDENMVNAAREELAPFEVAAAKAKLERAAEDPLKASTRSAAAFEAVRSSIPPQYISGKKAMYRLQAAQAQARIPGFTMPTDAEMDEMARQDYVEEFGIFRRNEAGRYEPPDPFAAMMAGQQ